MNFYLPVMHPAKIFLMASPTPVKSLKYSLEYRKVEKSWDVCSSRVTWDLETSPSLNCVCVSREKLQYQHVATFSFEYRQIHHWRANQQAPFYFPAPVWWFQKRTSSFLQMMILPVFYASTSSAHFQRYTCVHTWQLLGRTIIALPLGRGCASHIQAAGKIDCAVGVSAE